MVIISNMVFRYMIILCCVYYTVGGIKLNKKMMRQVLKRHNEIRAEHGVGPLKLSKELSKYSQKWANNIAKRGTLDHRKNTIYGESISFIPGAFSGESHVDNLYVDEEKFYRSRSYYGKEPLLKDFLEYGHFTQIVWKKSKKIGVGVSKGRVVINYQPAGNYIGQFKENVFKKQKGMRNKNVKNAN